MYSESWKEFKLETVKLFNLRAVMIIGGDKTSYTCEYIENYKWILNMSFEETFVIDGGILKYGSLKSSKVNTQQYSFCVMMGASAYFNMRHIEIEFVSTMDCFINMQAGTVCIEYVKIENEMTKWVSPLIVASPYTSSVTIELFSLNISNCSYNSDSRSGIIHNFRTLYFNPIFFNMSSSYIRNSSFSLNSSSCGGVSCFSSFHDGSGFSLLILFIFFFCF
jgi:hypothetical protein